METKHKWCALQELRVDTAQWLNDQHTATFRAVMRLQSQQRTLDVQVEQAFLEGACHSLVRTSNYLQSTVNQHTRPTPWKLIKLAWWLLFNPWPHEETHE